MPRTRRKPTDEPQLDTTPETQAAKPAVSAAPETAPPEAPQRPLEELEFFDHLRLMPERDWGEHICYLYRGGTDVIKADPTKAKFIDKIGGPFDEAYVKERFGGGRYMVILKNLKLGDAERKYSFEIDGPPKLQPDEVRRQTPGGQTEVNTGSPATDQLIERLVAQTVDAWKGRALDAEGSKPDDDAMAIMADNMRRACQAAIEIVKDVRAAPAPSDPVQQLAQMLGVLRELGVIDRKESAKPQLREIFSELRDVFGIEPATILGGGGRGGPDWRTALAAQVPNVLGTVSQGIAAWDRHTQATLQLALQRPLAGDPAQPAAPVAPEPPPAPQRQPQAPAATAPGRMTDGSIDLEWTKRFIVRQFQRESAGEFAAELLREMFPDHVGLFAAAFGDPEAVLAFARSDAVLAAILTDDTGEAFIRELAATLASPATPEAA